MRRCQRCLLPEKNCLCAHISPQYARSRFCLVMFDSEPMKPSNTGRLIADILPNTLAYGWSRTAPDPHLLAAAQHPDYQPMVVFPKSYANSGRSVLTAPPRSGKPPLFIMLDGTWAEASKMFHKSPWLDHLPMMSLSLDGPSMYTLRKAHTEAQYCTAEVAAELLAQAGDHVASATLAEHFIRFRTHYLAGKSHHSRQEHIPATEDINAPQRMQCGSQHQD